MKKITICGSISNLQKIKTLKKQIENDYRYKIFSPDNADALLDESEVTKFEPIYRKSKALEVYLSFIKQSDAILVANFDKGVNKGYIGTGVFSEMSFAFALSKPIFIYQNIFESVYYEDIMAFNPIILNRNLSRLET